MEVEEYVSVNAGLILMSSSRIWESVLPGLSWTDIPITTEITSRVIADGQQ
jgi:hypothetical protein